MKVDNRKILMIAAVIFTSIACQEDHDLGAPLKASDLKFSVTQDPAYDHRVYLASQTDGIIPFWDYGLGISNHPVDTIVIPFGGDFWIKYSALGRAGAVTDSAKITIAENDPAFFSDPKWNFLTNGAAGKTWIFDPTDPISYYGDGWLYDPGTCPDWSGFPCGTDWGEVTFDLNGRYNLTVKQKASSGDTYATKKGGFSFNMAENTLTFIGVPMLSSANNVNWKQAVVMELSENVLYLGFVASDGGHIRFKYIPKT